MPGFFVSNDRFKAELVNLYPQRCEKEELSLSDGTAARHTLRKFMDDKAFTETEEAVIVSDGVLLNKRELFARYDCADTAALLWKMYQAKGEDFANMLRGPFVCALFDKGKKLWLVYTCHIGDQSVFYALGNGFFYAGSQMNYVVDACRARGVALHFDERSAYELMTIGNMEADNTFACEIRRLRGGTYLRVENGKAEVREYHRFTRHPERFAGKTEAELIEEIDRSFRHAVALEYEKDEEYGYAHLCDMSGGMDSRMNAWVAHELKPRHIQYMTYCKADYLDEKIAKQIARYWNDEILIKPLDDASFMYDAEENTFMMAGLSDYSRLTGGKRMLESLNMDKFGLEHTGQEGGAIIGSYYRRLSDIEAQLPKKRASERFLHRLEESGYHDRFEDHELYLLYVRGFNGICNTHQIRRNFTEPVSPYLDADFAQLCLDLPVELRVGRYIYKKWVVEKYPDAAQFIWEKDGSKLTDSRQMEFVRKVIHKGPDKLRKMLGHYDKVANDMNPMDYWVSNHPDVRAFMDECEQAGYACLPADVSAQLIEDMREQYRLGGATEKFLVLTVLTAAKLFFANGEKT